MTIGIDHCNPYDCKWIKEYYTLARKSTINTMIIYTMLIYFVCVFVHTYNLYIIYNYNIVI